MLTMRRALQLLLAALAMGVAMEAFSRQKKWCIQIWQGEGGDVFMMSMDSVAEMQSAAGKLIETVPHQLNSCSTTSTVHSWCSLPVPSGRRQTLTPLQRKVSCEGPNSLVTSVAS
jgi:hypothetical protein